MLLDIVIIIILVGFIIWGFKKGFLEAIFGLISYLASFVLAYILFAPFSAYIKSLANVKAALDWLKSSIAAAILPTLSGNINQAQTTEGLQSFTFGLISDQYIKGSLQQGVQAAASSLAGLIATLTIDVLIFIALIFIIKIGLWIVIYIVKLIAKLPVLNIVNKALGGIAGALNGVIVIYILTALLFAIASVPDNKPLKDEIGRATIAKYFCENNIILNLTKKRV